MIHNETYHDKYGWFYASKEWQILRDYKYRLANGLCEKCLSQGIVKQGKEVHHIKPIETNWDMRLNIDNLVLLCRDCHNAIHDRQSDFQKFLDKWEE